MDELGETNPGASRPRGGDGVAIAGGGRDVHDGGAGDDFLSSKAGHKAPRIDLRDEEAGRGQAADTVTGFERIDGSRHGGDRVWGDREDDRLRGGDDDRLDGRDRIDGGRGDDRHDSGFRRKDFSCGKYYDSFMILNLKSCDTILLDVFHRSEVREGRDDARRDDGDLVLRFGEGDRPTIEDASRPEVSDAMEIP